MGPGSRSLRSIIRDDERIPSGHVLYDLKKLFAASFEARFLVMATCSRSISEVISASTLGEFLDRQQREVLPSRSRG